MSAAPDDGAMGPVPVVKTESLASPAGNQEATTPELDPLIDGAGPSDGEGSIRIIREEDGKFFLNSDGVQAIMERAQKISDKVAVVSLVGDFRTGKSFMLNMLSRYLRYHEHRVTKGGEHAAEQLTEKGVAPAVADEEKTAAVKQEAEDAPGAGQGLSDWMKFGGSQLLEGQKGSGVPGFYWEGGMARRTHGIWMYGRPFPRKLPNTDETVAVILMDTQGMFDFKTPPELTAAIFGLSTLISSNQVYNIKFQIQEDKLQQLHYFTEFSRVAIREFEQAQRRADMQQRAQTDRKHTRKHSEFDALDLNATTPARDQPGAVGGGPPSLAGLRQRGPAPPTGSHAALPSSLSDGPQAAGQENAGPPFQHLHFLVRDWQNFTDDEDLQLCLKEMPEVLDNAMQHQMDDQGTRAEIKSAFEVIKCFLLPHPGRKMAHKAFTGELDTVEPTFLRLLDLFVDNLFQGELVAKKIQGRFVSPGDLSKYITAYAGVFRDGCMPQAMSLVRAMSTVSNLVSKTQSLDVYKNSMTSLARDFLPEEQLRQAHDDSVGIALDHFDATATFGSDGSIQECRESLEAMMEEQYGEYVERNKLKIMGGLKKYAIVLVVCVAAWIVDRTTDYTCDAWSETFRDASRLLAYVTYAALALLIWKFVSLYREQGATLASMNALAVARSALEQTHEWRAKVEAMVLNPGRRPSNASGPPRLGLRQPSLTRQPSVTSSKKND